MLATLSIQDRVPDDVLRLILENLWLTPLVRLMRVSSRWRKVIVELPVYWRDISLDKLEPATVDFFLLRMRRSSSKRSIRVYISFNPYGRTSRPPVPASVMASVADHLHHIQILHIAVPLSYSDDILAALVHPAPLLEDLTIRLQIRRASYVCDGDDSPYEISAEELYKIPTTLFAQDAPLLRTVSLTNVFCREDARVCFALVTKASIDTSLLRIAMPDPFDLFPAARELRLCAYVVDARGPMYSADSWRNIVALELKGQGAAWGEANLPLAEIPRITYHNWDSRCIRMALDHLRGPLELHLQVDEKQEKAAAHVVSASHGTILRRSFVTWLSNWYYSPLFDGPRALTDSYAKSLLRVFADDPRRVGQRIDIDNLRISGTTITEIWLGFFEYPLPALTTLVLEDLTCMPGPFKLQCPSLCNVTLVGSPALRSVTQAAVDDFIRSCLMGPCLPLHLETRDLTVKCAPWNGVHPSFVMDDDDDGVAA